MTHTIKGDRRSRPGWVVSGIVEAPVAEVWRVLLDLSDYLSPTEKTAILSNATPFTTTKGTSGQGRIHIEVDPHAHSIAMQGEWWYRGVTIVEPHPKGSLVASRVYNIAPGIGWWAAQWVQGPQHARLMPTTHEQLLDAIAERLGCKTHLIEGE